MNTRPRPVYRRIFDEWGKTPYDLIISMRRVGMRWSDISQALGISEATVWAYMRYDENKYYWRGQRVSLRKKDLIRILV